MGEILRGAALRRLNDARSQRYVLEIQRALKKCKRRREKFAEMGALVAYVARETNIDRTTLMRNPRYRTLIWNYFILHGGFEADVTDEVSSREILLHKLTKVRLEVRRLRDECAKYRALVVRNSAPVDIDSSGPIPDAQRDAFVDFMDTASVLALVIERCNGVIVVNKETGSIEDLSARPSHKIIAQAPRTRGFFKWLKSQPLSVGVPPPDRNG